MQEPVVRQVFQDRDSLGLDRTSQGIQGQQALVFSLDHADRVDHRIDKKGASFFRDALWSLI